MTKARKIKFKSKGFKGQKKPPNTKKGRLIIRNLPFSITEDALKEHFSSYGEIQDVTLLKKPDGKLVGCGFVQFTRKQSAAKAIHYTSGKPLQGRTIVVDWAVPKDKFAKPKVLSKTPKPDVKDEPNDEESRSKDHSDDDDNDSVKSEPQSETSLKDEVEEDDESDSETEGSIDNEDYISIKKEDSICSEIPRPKPSHDINEGKTVFLKNVPFDVTNDELRAFITEKIGPVYFAVVCMDPLTEHSKGTAFVKFKDAQNADKCLNAGSELKFKGCPMEPLPALDKKDLMDKRDRHPDKKKDNRNLYLVKEGVVIAGTSAAKDVSMGDMKKRLELEMWKSNMLRDLNMFISRTRLIIHNLPVQYDDKMLRTLFKKHSPPKSKIIEAKVMRNLRQLDKDGKPLSKGYGFVSYTEHDHALAALRAVNNNPNVFHKNKRPIVAFSIENRAVHTIKQRRTDKSKQNNPLCPESKKPNKKNDQKPKFESKKRRHRSDNVPTFAGMESHPGHTKLPSKRKILAQKEMHTDIVRGAKKDNKRKKQMLQTRKEKIRDPKVKQKGKKTDFNEKQFNTLVNQYKKKILPNVSLKKWYENS